MSSSLTEIVLPHRPPDLPSPAAVTDGDRHSLFVALEVINDPRDPRGRRYPLVSVLAAAVCAVLAGSVYVRRGRRLDAFSGHLGVGSARVRRPGARRDDGVAVADPA